MRAIIFFIVAYIEQETFAHESYYWDINKCRKTVLQMYKHTSMQHTENDITDTNYCRKKSFKIIFKEMNTNKSSSLYEYTMYIMLI